MKATVQTPLTREEVAEHFAQWRRIKKKGERIPERLWSEALGLLSEYSVSEVTRTLRLSGADLKKRQAALADDKNSCGSDSEIAFVEIDRHLVNPSVRPNGTALVLELERPDGLRLRIQGTNGVEMLALVGRFLGA